MNWSLRGLILLVASARAQLALRQYGYGDSGDKVIEDCKQLINSEPAYAEMCQRICAIAVSEKRCVGKKSGAELAACVSKEFPYCEQLPVELDVVEDCKTKITSDPVYQDMCRRSCRIVVSRPKCSGKTNGAALAACVHEEFPYCSVKN